MHLENEMSIISPINTFELINDYTLTPEVTDVLFELPLPYDCYVSGFWRKTIDGLSFVFANLSSNENSDEAVERLKEKMDQQLFQDLVEDGFRSKGITVDKRFFWLESITRPLYLK